MMAITNPDSRDIFLRCAIQRSHSRQVRKVIKNRGHFPSDEAATKLIYLALCDIIKKWLKAPINWTSASAQIAMRAPIIALLIRVRGPESDATMPVARCAAAPPLGGDCPLPQRLEMSGSAPACQRLMQIVHHRNPYSVLLGHRPASYRG